MKKHKILLLCGKDNVLFDFSDDLNVIKENVYKNMNKRILQLFCNVPIFYKYALEDWKYNIKTYTDIIIFDSNFKYEVVNYIKKNSINSKIILYFRNSVKSQSRLDIDKLKKMDIDIWSYNKADCEEYGLKYNGQNWNPLLKTAISETEKNDLIFVGEAKGRIEYLNKLHNYCKKEGLKDYFYLVGYENEEFNKNKDSCYLGYKKNVELANSSLAIVDIVTEKNYAMTLRPLEALFLNKKLVTNYKEIKNEKFYNVNNIFILNNNYEEIADFLKTPYVAIDEAIKEQYTCTSWMLRFFE